MPKRAKSEWEAFKARRIRKGLSDVYGRTPRAERTLDADEDRLVIFSDHHKGSRGPADDFWRCEAAYRAALAFYLELRYRLVVLGDVEELWEEPNVDRVLEEYKDTLRLEGAFAAKEDFYFRVWGNHDPDWSEEEKTPPLARALGLETVPIREALRIPVTAGGRSGELFLVHGHQGTLSSDVLARASKPLVRYGWKTVQGWINRPWNTPARDSVLRAAHDRTMWEWAETRPERLVLIAGHTHRPVFKQDRPGTDIAGLERQLADIPDEPELRNERAKKHAELEAARASLETTPDLAPIEMRTPCYFNTGCASFGDGSVTALEIADGTFRLVRWPWPYGREQLLPEEMASAKLAEVLAAVSEESDR